MAAGAGGLSDPQLMASTLTEPRLGVGFGRGCGKAMNPMKLHDVQDPRACCARSSATARPPGCG
jgi:hypothetical protein